MTYMIFPFQSCVNEDLLSVRNQYGVIPSAVQRKIRVSAERVGDEVKGKE